jgi:hypothetical protein
MILPGVPLVLLSSSLLQAIRVVASNATESVLYKDFMFVSSVLEKSVLEKIKQRQVHTSDFQLW